MKTANIIRWIARIWGTLIVAFIMVFLIAHIFDINKEGTGFDGNKDILTFIFFPLSTLVGLSLALKWEKLGGLIATLGMVGLFVMRSDLMSDIYFALGIAPPGILYLVYYYLHKNNAGDTKS